MTRGTISDRFTILSQGWQTTSSLEIGLAAAMADKPVQRASLKEKLEAFKVQAAGVGKPEIGKAKGKEETL